MIRRHFARLLGVSFAVAALGSGCSEAPAAGDCDKLFEHLVSLEEAASSASADEKAKHRAAIGASSGAAFVKRCEENIKASQVTCSLKAQNMTELEACDSKAS